MAIRAWLSKRLAILGLPLVITACASDSVQIRKKTVALTGGPVAPAGVAETGPAGSTGPVVLKTPMRVGLAFAPTKGPQNEFPAALRLRLLEKVREAFQRVSFVDAIEIVPASFLTEGSEFEGIASAAQAFHLDAVTILTYDQEQFSGTSNWAALYWTGVGTYLVPAERGETRTLIEASVVDTRSQVLLLRAAATDEASGGSTPVNRDRYLRDTAEASVERATENLIVELREELERVQSDLREGKKLYGVPVRFVDQSTSSAQATRPTPEAADVGWWFAAVAVGLTWMASRQNSKFRANFEDRRNPWLRAETVPPTARIGRLEFRDRPVEARSHSCESAI